MIIAAAADDADPFSIGPDDIGPLLFIYFYYLFCLYHTMYDIIPF